MCSFVHSRKLIDLWGDLGTLRSKRGVSPLSRIHCLGSIAVCDRRANFIVRACFVFTGSRHFAWPTKKRRRRAWTQRSCLNCAGSAAWALTLRPQILHQAKAATRAEV